jgi:hypothetical protein
MRNGRYILVLALALALLGAVGAEAAGTYAAHAKRPSYDAGSLELSGAGSLFSGKKRPLLKVTVCLRKRVGSRSFDVRCTTTEGSGHKVKGSVSVPGCVAGVWRTAVIGEAFNKKGQLVGMQTAGSRPFRC